MTHYWARSDRYSALLDDSWHFDDQRLADSPLFASAMATEYSVFIENVDAKSETLRTVDPFVRGEQALVQGHISKRGQLWGILRICVFDRPRPWMQFDHSLIIHTVQKLVPTVINYVETKAP
ncbi:hypothetical protein IQ260_02125 [Leptolyngbya cf. ectocarpi LEGE 11479]|uniref:GAF domain-containing protein n=1 Tax=Leptolyngbya cf. ectocarpi LEGE 11479 TaxID=1828722 RepID=A0A928WXU8_LEPEC|nr:hypothetical protein [Leptolyngbya ectocarpi]MBE9065445.1 hypothetical protein [Leptolyngbya cf. ectocarpi LEGE 11479]